MQSNTSTTNPIIDAVDALNAARSMLSFVLEKRTPDDSHGETWVLGHIEDWMKEAIAALDTARKEMCTDQAE